MRQNSPPLEKKTGEGEETQAERDKQLVSTVVLLTNHREKKIDEQESKKKKIENRPAETLPRKEKKRKTAKPAA